MRIIRALLRILLRVLLIVLGVLVTVAYIISLPIHMIVFIITGSKVVEMVMFEIMGTIYEKLEDI